LLADDAAGERHRRHVRRSRVDVDDERRGGRGLGTAEVDLGGEVCYRVLYGEESDDAAQAADARS
jgi:hypothetical protein